MASLVETTTPLVAEDTWTSPVQSLTRATTFSGLVYSDVAGTLYIEQSGDGENFDVSTPFAVLAMEGVAIEEDVLGQYFRVRYVNGDSHQATFRLFVDARDPYGDFLVQQSGPSSGGAWLVLVADTQDHYKVVGRFDGADGWAANGAAAINQDKSGKYAAFVIADATVTIEQLQTTTQHTPASF